MCSNIMTMSEFKLEIQDLSLMNWKKMKRFWTNLIDGFRENSLIRKQYCLTQILKFKPESPLVNLDNDSENNKEKEGRSLVFNLLWSYFKIIKFKIKLGIPIIRTAWFFILNFSPNFFVIKFWNL